MEEEGELAREAGLARAHVAEQDDAKLLREVQSLAAENNRMNDTAVCNVGIKTGCKNHVFRPADIRINDFAHS